MTRVEVARGHIDCLDMVGTLCRISDFIDEGSLHHVVTLNAEILYKAQSEPEILEIINGADLVTPDGSGIVWAVKKLHNMDIERVTGIDLLNEICHQSKKTGWKLFFLGAAPGVAEKAAERIYDECEAEIVGTQDGYFSTDDERKIVHAINKVEPDILFVAMGCPKQDEFILRNREFLRVPVAIGVGGSFDVLAGNVRRAPKIFQKLGIEWLWRLVSQPTRIGRMMSLPKFTLMINRIAKQKNREAGR